MRGRSAAACAADDLGIEAGWPMVMAKELASSQVLHGDILKLLVINQKPQGQADTIRNDLFEEI